MKTVALIDHLNSLGIELWESDGELRFRSPEGIFTDEMKKEIRDNKQEVIQFLSSDNQLIIEADPSASNEPFPLSEIQAAYVIGRNSAIPYGGIPCIAYMELELPELNVEQFELALRDAIKQHAALRTRFYQAGFQQVESAPPLIEVKVHRMETALLDSHCGLVRAALLAEALESDVETLPLFSIEVTFTSEKVVMHVCIHLLVADFVSVNQLLDRLVAVANGQQQTIATPSISFRDVVLATRRFQNSQAYRKARAYWLDKIEQIYAAPALPTLPDADAYHIPSIGPLFKRLSTVIEGADRDRFLSVVKSHALTPSAVMLAAYIEVVRRWSLEKEFSLIITMMNRPPVHPQIDQVVGDFTSTILFQAAEMLNSSFLERTKSVQEALWKDLEYQAYSGVELLREIARSRGPANSLMPVVFTSTTGTQNHKTGSGMTLRDGITWTPQVWLDCQLLEAHGRLYVNWDYRSGIIPEEVVSDMFNAFDSLLRELIESADVWNSETVVRLPALPKFEEEYPSLPQQTLHHGVLEACAQFPENTAVIDRFGSYCYQTVYNAACRIAQRLADQNASTFLPVVMDKGVEQVVAVLGILISGRAYVPIAPDTPMTRQQWIVEDCAASHVLTQTWISEQLMELDASVMNVVVSETTEVANNFEPVDIAVDQVAYIIYTSGTTGKPKGVLMTHSATANTIQDINLRLQLNDKDRLLGLSSLSFDLSVFDIFGTLSVGASLVLPEPDKKMSPAHWHELIEKHLISIWNSVPTLADLYEHYIRDQIASVGKSLRWMLVSGDWVPVSLAGRLKDHYPNLNIISLGGATEAAIWSIYHLIEEEDALRPSVPYGRALIGQSVTILNNNYEQCPIGVVGDIYISGVGLALGYHNDADKTAERFIDHPVTGEVLYWTGDLGRFLPEGNIEFLGREDHQVKIRGHRVELGEISSALEAVLEVQTAIPVFERGAIENGGGDSLLAFVVRAKCDNSIVLDRQQYLHALSKQQKAYSDQLVACTDVDMLTKLSNALDLGSMSVAKRKIIAAMGDRAWTIVELCNVWNVTVGRRRLVERLIVSLLQNELIQRRAKNSYSVLNQTSVETSQGWLIATECATAIHYPIELIDYFKYCSEQFDRVISGEINPVEIFTPQGRDQNAMALFRDNPVAQIGNKIAANTVKMRINDSSYNYRTKPFKILEIGAGFGALSEVVIDCVRDSNIEYLLTDISSFYLDRFEQAYRDDERIATTRFDVMQSPESQGLEQSEYDLVLCGDVLHAITDIPKALGSIGELLKPGGVLVMLEASVEHPVALMSLETMLGTDESDVLFTDFREQTGCTFPSQEQWLSVLEDCAFTVSEPLLDASLSKLGLQVYIATNRIEIASVSTADLRSIVRRTLPNYMQPHAIRFVDEVPLTRNGKVDHDALLRTIQPFDNVIHNTNSSTPISETDRWIADIWLRTLNINSNQFNRGFFEIGGDSLTAARLAGDVVNNNPPERHELLFDEVLKEIMMGPSLSEFVAALSKKANSLSAKQVLDTDHTERANVSIIQQSTSLANVLNRSSMDGSDHLYIIVDVQPTGMSPSVSGIGETPLVRHQLSAPIGSLAANLVASGQVSTVGINLLATDYVYKSVGFHSWINDAVSQIPIKEHDSVSVLAIGSDALLGIGLSTEILVAQPDLKVNCKLISPSNIPVEASAKLNNIQSQSSDFFLFNLDILLCEKIGTYQINSNNQFAQKLSRLCLGHETTKHERSVSLDSDATLDWLEELVEEVAS